MKDSIVYDRIFFDGKDYIAEDNFGSKLTSKEEFFSKKCAMLGSKYLLANGSFGCRGTLEEYGKEYLPALNIGGLYDRAAGDWRETVNAPNPLYTAISCNGMRADVFNCTLLSHTFSLDIFSGIFRRETVFKIGGVKLTVESERALSADREGLILSRYCFYTDRSAEIELHAGIDCDVWDISGCHLRDKSVKFSDSISVKLKTVEKSIDVVTGLKLQTDFDAAEEDSHQTIKTFTMRAAAGRRYQITKFGALTWGENAERENAALLLDAEKAGYETLLRAHTAAFQALWQGADVEIEGDERAQLALRYSIYHLLILSPRGNRSISARGLSGQTYKGAVFWDTEIFLFPFYLAQDYALARRLIKYRIDGLSGAMTKAKHYGFEGAFYAWESQEDGFEACSDFNVVDVFTKRNVRTYFKDKQIHISADVVYALVKYFEETEDFSILTEGGLLTALQCCRFFYSYSRFNHNADRFELLDVIGPDEYHERVNNNAFTNYMVYFAVEKTLGLCEIVQKWNPRQYEEILSGFGGDFLQKLATFKDKLYLPRANENGVIEQFDGYFRLEDVSVEEVRSRLVNPREYWGGSGGVATATRVIKQADVVTLLYLLPEYFSEDVVRANYDFYLKYTEHGSSLSACMYALVACRLGLPENAWELFLKTATIDLTGDSKQYAGLIYIGGTHPAASGGAWLCAVKGFAGYDGGKLSPRLPERLKSVKFNVLCKGVRQAFTAR